MNAQRKYHFGINLSVIDITYIVIVSFAHCASQTSHDAV